MSLRPFLSRWVGGGQRRASGTQSSSGDTAGKQANWSSTFSLVDRRTFVRNTCLLRRADSSFSRLNTWGITSCRSSYKLPPYEPDRPIWPPFHDSVCGTRQLRNTKREQSSQQQSLLHLGVLNTSYGRCESRRCSPSKIYGRNARTASHSRNILKCQRARDRLLDLL